MRTTIATRVAERFVREDLGIVRNVSEDRRLVEVAAKCVRPAAGDEAKVLCHFTKGIRCAMGEEEEGWSWAFC